MVSIQAQFHTLKQTATTFYRSITPATLKVGAIQTGRFLGAPLLPIARHFRPSIPPISLKLGILSGLFWVTLISTPFLYPHLKGRFFLYKVKRLEKSSENAFRKAYEAAKLLELDLRYISKEFQTSLSNISQNLNSYSFESAEIRKNPRRFNPSTILSASDQILHSFFTTYRNGLRMVVLGSKVLPRYQEKIVPLAKRNELFGQGCKELVESVRNTPLDSLQTSALNSGAFVGQDNVNLKVLKKFTNSFPLF